MTALPVLLLFALVLFCAGLSILLITLDMTVGVVAVCMIGFVRFLFSSATTTISSYRSLGIDIRSRVFCVTLRPTWDIMGSTDIAYLRLILIWWLPFVGSQISTFN